MNHVIKRQLLAKYFENQQHISGFFAYDIAHVKIFKKMLFSASLL